MHRAVSLRQYGKQGQGQADKLFDGPVCQRKRYEMDWHSRFLLSLLSITPRIPSHLKKSYVFFTACHAACFGGSLVYVLERRERTSPSENDLFVPTVGTGATGASGAVTAKSTISMASPALLLAMAMAGLSLLAVGRRAERRAQWLLLVFTQVRSTPLPVGRWRLIVFFWLVPATDNMVSGPFLNVEAWKSGRVPLKKQKDRVNTY